MKKAILLAILGFMTLSFTRTGYCAPKESGVTISGAWALYPMAVKWRDEYAKKHPDVRIDISAGGAGKGIADTLAGMVDIGMVSREIRDEEKAKGALPFAVCKDAVVCTISEANPLMSRIMAKGVKHSALEAAYITGGTKTWAELLKIEAKEPLTVYTRSDSCGAAEVWANFFKKKQEDLTGIGVYGDPGITAALKTDPLGIGYNNLNFAYDSKTLKPVAGIQIAPIDLNEDGKIDKSENFYATRAAFTDAIKAGKYPAALSRTLYLVTKGKPANPAVAAFLEWVLTEGQQHVTAAGYLLLPKKTIKDGIRQIK